MVLTEVTGLLCVLVGGYALARPLSIRTYPTGDRWRSDPDGAERDQRAYATMAAFFTILGGVALVVLGLLGYGP